ncbi:histone deacetylase [Thermoproteus tenax]|uniref:Histone deacetylase family enzyme n=1 Tax=Thermoproteus tenax (strain ATCC 35583 / DSM 2078 / JCM 9277 / NBRC 100435 / Kra 1) TaxID=768679 RepID=G4RJG3_THETK|nr:histone deacetylase [Thermoproteus tenax]CCC81708.1 Histone deacetylase family enzyme [Thermoproteus tenax Kra 1]
MKILVGEHRDERIEALPPELLERVRARGSWDDYMKIHGGPLASEAKRREAEVLAELGLLDEALRRGRAIVASYPPRLIGHSSGKGGYLNPAAYLAAKTGYPLISFDAHFPWGTWELHLKLGFPLLAIYSGAEGPHPGRLAKRSDRIVAVPLPPGASDQSLEAAISLAEGLGPVVLEVGLDFYYREPSGHFFATDRTYYRLGALVGRGGLAVLDCVSKASAEAAAALLAGAEGGPEPPDRPFEETRAVQSEAAAAIKKAKERARRIFKV